MAALLVMGPGLPAQDTDAVGPATAILQVGPEARRGIDALAPDLTPHWYGRYRIDAASVAVYYAREPLAEPPGWPLAPCPVRTLRARGPSLAYYESSGGWSILVSLVQGELPGGVTICRFVDRFVARHLLFENLELVRLPGRAPVFPAVIEL